FFQAEDGIRDRNVTGVQTCALPISELTTRNVTLPAGSSTQDFDVPGLAVGLHQIRSELTAEPDTYPENNVGEAAVRVLGRPLVRSEERRVGKGCRARRSPCH